VVRQTLFYVPHEIAGLPVFGWGWVLICWIVFSGWTLYRDHRRNAQLGDTLGHVPLIALVALAILFLLPRIEEPIPPGFLTLPPAPAQEGLPIRGYGTLLLVAVVAGVGLALWRAQSAGLKPDLMMSLSFVMVLGGIVGARLLFVIQYWNEIRAPSLGQTLINIVSTVQGGLVVYGSLIGGLGAFLAFAWRYRLPVLPLADLIIPSLALGVAIGRLGCLLNGCCFGDVCHHDYAWAVTFPASSPPYLRQQSLGLMHGLRIAEDDQGGVRVQSLDPHGPLANQPISVGDPIRAINGQPIARLDDAQRVLEPGPLQIVLDLGSGRQVRAILTRPPARSLPVHPTQLYAAFNAAVLCLVGLAVFPFRRRHGQTFALVLSAYAVTRFLLEEIRTDEGALMGGMTISQNISLAVLLGMAALWVFIQRQPPINLGCPVGRQGV
jgi:phosphatidylglycerol:prolipoprotein diacylglycerol transferase